MYGRILVGTDGSPTAAKAVDLAGLLAGALGAELWIVSAGTDASVVEAAAKDVSDYGARVRTETREGDPQHVLLDVVREQDVGLIVVGDRGMARGRHVLLGSVPDKIAHHAGCDVLIVRTSSPGFEGYERVLIATDGSRTADRAARKGLDLADRMMLSTTLVHVGHPKTGELLLADTARNIGGGVDADLRPVEGKPVEAILAVAEEVKADLLVVGNKGMSGARGILLGSVPQALSQLAPCDVLIVRTATVYASELQRGEGAIIVVQGQKVAAFLDDEGTMHAVSAKCTHMGCTVGWNAAERTWDCPCHGSRYTIDGSNIEGPAPKPLPKVDV